MFKKISLFTISLALSAPAFAQDKTKYPCEGVRSITCLSGVAIGGIGVNSLDNALKNTATVKRAGQNREIGKISNDRVASLFSEVQPGDKITVAYRPSQAEEIAEALKKLNTKRDGFQALMTITRGEELTKINASYEATIQRISEIRNGSPLTALERSTKPLTKDFASVDAAKSFLAKLKSENKVVLALARSRTDAQHLKALRLLRGQKVAGGIAALTGIAIIGVELHATLREQAIEDSEATINVQTYQEASAGNLRKVFTERQAYLDLMIEGEVTKKALPAPRDASK